MMIRTPIFVMNLTISYNLLRVNAKLYHSLNLLQFGDVNFKPYRSALELVLEEELETQ